MSSRKRMSLRAQARMRRENRELRDRLARARREEQRSWLTFWASGDVQRTEVSTALRLGFTVEVALEGDGLRFIAVKRVSA